MLAGAIRKVVGPAVRIVDSAETTAHTVRATLAKTKEHGVVPSPTASVRFLATDSVERFVRIGSRFLERPIAPEEVELVDL